jgi:hypothetical protein
MSLFKTGHKDFPSLSYYTSLLEKHGPLSEQAQSYLGRFISDDNFVRQAEVVRNIFLMKKTISPNENN